MINFVYRIICYFLVIFVGLILLPGCNSGRTNAGLYLGKNYDDNINTGYGYSRIVFAASTADLYLRLQDGCYVIKIDGVDRIDRTGDKSDYYVGDDSSNKYDGYLESNLALPSSVPSIQLKLKDASNVFNIPETETIYKKSDIESIAVAKPGDWYCYLKATPVDYINHSIVVHWDGCTAPGVCTDAGNNAEVGTFTVDDDAKTLTSTQNSSYQYKLQQ